MTISELWAAAFRKLGASDEAAEEMVAFIKGMSRSGQEFEQWDSSVPPAIATAIMKGLNGPSGHEIAQQIVGNFRDEMMAGYGISEQEVFQRLHGIGLN